MALVSYLTRAGRQIASGAAPHVRTAEAILVLAVVLLFTTAVLPGGRADALPEVSEVTHRVDLNTAPWHELVNLPGIGDVRAKEIVRDRDARGPFRSPGELERVHGIGPATVKALTEILRGR
jgi:competence ComEA-like helix-hairpin-helix protein